VLSAINEFEALSIFVLKSQLYIAAVRLKTVVPQVYRY
jgi:hypothetical protein